MKFYLLLVLLCCGCAYSPVDVGLSEIRYHDDAPVVLSELVEAVVPHEVPESGLRALILPFAVRQDISVRKDVSREMTDIFRLAWLNRRVFEVMEYEPSAPWPGLGQAMAQARAKGANILVSGHITQYFEGGRTGRTSIGVTVEIHWVPDGSLVWSAAQAATMEGAPDKDFALFRSSRRLPENPTYAVMRTLSESMAAGFARHAAQ
jgi:hypothetical protein